MNSLSQLPKAALDRLLAEALAENQRRKLVSTLPDYTTPDGIIAFVRDVLLAEPTPYQEKILRALVEHRRVSARMPHGGGKTALAAWVTLWGMSVFNTDVKIPTTAGAWRQLEYFLWPEIKKWARRAKLPEQPQILHMGLRLPDKEAFAVASDQPELIEGAHAETLIYIFDESKAIQDDTWDAAEGAFSGAGEDTGAQAFALAISTPGTTEGRFYAIQSRKPGYEDWHVIHVTLEECIEAGRISRKWAEQRKAQWGETSSVYQNRVLGEFATDSEDSVIPLSWVEAANERWHACKGKGDKDGVLSVGCDPARYGDDPTAIARERGNVVEKIEYHAKEDTMQTAGRLAATCDKQTQISIDVIGLGAGVYDRLRELGYRVTPVNVSEATSLRDKSGELSFLNLRSALWWKMRERLNPAGENPIALPPDDRLTGDLVAPKWGYTSRGVIQVESKDQIRQRLKRSTDAADAVILADYPNLGHVTYAWKPFAF